MGSTRAETNTQNVLLRCLSTLLHRFPCSLMGVFPHFDNLQRPVAPLKPMLIYMIQLSRARHETQGYETNRIDFWHTLRSSKNTFPVDAGLHIAQGNYVAQPQRIYQSIFSYSTFNYIFHGRVGVQKYHQKTLILDKITIGFPLNPFIKALQINAFRWYFSTTTRPGKI